MLTNFHSGGIPVNIGSLWERVFLCIFLDLLIYSCIIKALNKNYTKRDEFVSTAYYT